MRNSGGHVGAIFVIDRYDGYIDRFSLVKCFKGRNGMGMGGEMVRRMKCLGCDVDGVVYVVWWCETV